MALTMAQRQAVTKANATRYKRADKAGKGLMLDELCATRSIKSSRIVIAKGTVGMVAGKHGIFSTKHSVRFATPNATALVRDVSVRDLVPAIVPGRGSMGRGTQTVGRPHDA